MENAPTPLRTFLNDGEHYDALYSHPLPDIAFWVRRAREVGGDVLELACGTGRVSVAIAAAGLNVVGIDLEESYLSVARQKANRLNLKANFQLADVREFELARSFSLVAFPFRSVGVLLTMSDVLACFARVRQHVEPGGLFIVDAHNASLRSPALFETMLSYQPPGNSQKIEVHQARKFDQSTSINVSEFTFDWSSDSPRKFELRSRRYTAAELRSAMADNGFTVIEHLGGYEGSPYSQASQFQLLVGQAS